MAEQPEPGSKMMGTKVLYKDVRCEEIEGSCVEKIGALVFGCYKV